MIESAASLVCIDAELHSHLPASLLPDGKVVLLDPHRDGIQQITARLNQRQQHWLHRLHLLGYGSTSSLQLGITHLNLFTLDRYGWQLQQWGETLTADAEIFLYGCPPIAISSAPSPAQVLPTPAAQSSFLRRLQLLTGANLAALTLAQDRWDLAATSGHPLVCPVTPPPSKPVASLR